MCVTDKVTPVGKARELMKTIHNLCMAAKLESGEVN
jgi:hypothetical protein